MMCSRLLTSRSEMAAARACLGRLVERVFEGLVAAYDRAPGGRALRHRSDHLDR